jgi:hypothetical protein
VGSWKLLPEELKTEVFAGKTSNFNTWLKTKGWQAKDDAVTRWAKDNGYGSLLVSDDKRAAGLSHIILPDSIGDKGRARQVKQNITEFATVIVFLREKSGGFMFMHNDKTSQQFHIMLNGEYLLNLVGK